jgi:hypothetical protein
MAKVKQAQVAEIMDKTKTAYSRDRYGETAWRSNIESLLKAGFSAEHVEWLMLAKYARWSGDAFSKFDEATETELFDGTELMQYYHKWGFEDDNDKPILPK